MSLEPPQGAGTPSAPSHPTMGGTVAAGGAPGSSAGGAGHVGAGEDGVVEGTPGEPSDPSSAPSGAPAQGNRRWIGEWTVIIVVALVVAFLVRTFVAQTFYIPSTSMYPTLKDGNRIVVNKLAYDFHAVHQGDIVVFQRPPKENCGGSPVPDLVKRVIGLPGERIQFQDDKLYVDGKVTPEPWLPGPTARSTSRTLNFGPVTVPPHDYFVMGDNRMDSCDSRSWGPVTQTEIVGKVDVIVWPLSDLRFF